VGGPHGGNWGFSEPQILAVAPSSGKVLNPWHPASKFRDEDQDSSLGICALCDGSSFTFD